jgi:hypothetical protein
VHASPLTLIGEKAMLVKGKGKPVMLMTNDKNMLNIAAPNGLCCVSNQSFPVGGTICLFGKPFCSVVLKIQPIAKFDIKKCAVASHGVGLCYCIIWYCIALSPCRGFF